jgi:two-component system nitrogen regulation sensor histidine kinase NtrY
MPATLIDGDDDEPSGLPHGDHRQRRSMMRLLGDILLGKFTTLLLATAALLVGIATFTLLAGGISFGVGPSTVYIFVLASAVLLLLLGAVLAGRVTRVWVERRRGSAGSRLHVRLVLMFGGVAVVPAILVAVFASFFFSLGIQSWFNDRVRTALHESVEASRGYLQEHQETIRSDAASMASDLANASPELSTNPHLFSQFLTTQTGLRGLTMAALYEPVTGAVVAAANALGVLGPDPLQNWTAARPPDWARSLAASGEVAVFSTKDGSQVRAVVQLPTQPPLLLMIGRPVDAAILDHMKHTEEAVAEYDKLDQNRSGLEITFAMIFALVALLVLAAATLIGLVLANQIARPIGRLILAAERVRAGDLAVRVPETKTEDEVAGLSRAFNRMTGQLASQRQELMDAYSQIDERRRFTEAVLSGVSAGVIGLDEQGLITLPNSAANRLLGQDLLGAIGRPLAEIAPEFAPLLAAVVAEPERDHTAEVQIGPPTRRRVLLVRIGADLPAGEARGFVVTFDDITELQSAQRKAAWADVARRIAHEIKNPLTPIQLSAERLKRRFTREITSDPETFVQCADTIVRHVGDIGRMVDEFSAFARMPVPVMRPADLSQIAREALVLQRAARPEITWVTALPDRGPVVPCDRRLIGQALTNLLNNAAEAVSMRQGAGHIALSIEDVPGEECVSLVIEDDGVGLPIEEDRLRLMEPYVTHKPKGTGLGLAIVKKVMEDHGGRVTLDDRADTPGAVARLVLPRIAAPGTEAATAGAAGSLSAAHG